MRPRPLSRSRERDRVDESLLAHSRSYAPVGVRIAALGLLLLAVVTPARAHRVDEYLQAIILAVEKDGMRADMFLTPGVAVLPTILADIDSDGDGVLSSAEQRAYAARVLRDLSITLNGERLSPRLVAMEFPDLEETKAGRGDIHLEFSAAWPRDGRDGRLTLENQHHAAIAAYQVNCLIPSDPEIRIGAEQRNYSQSTYEVRFTQTGARSASPRLGRGLTVGRCLGAGAVLLLIGAAWRIFRLPRPSL